MVVAIRGGGGDASDGGGISGKVAELVVEAVENAPQLAMKLEGKYIHFVPLYVWPLLNCSQLSLHSASIGTAIATALPNQNAGLHHHSQRVYFPVSKC